MTVILPGGLGQLKPAAAGGSGWDPANKSSLAVLSNNNRTVTNSTAGTAGLVRGTRSQSSGKFYFELVLTNMGAGATGVSCYGACNSAYSISTGSFIGDDAAGNSVGLFENVGNNYILTFQAGNLTTIFIAPATGDVIGVNVDVTNKGMWFAVNGTNAGNVPGQAPSDLGGMVGPIFPAVSVDNGATITLVTAPPWNRGPGSGFLAWG